MTLIRDVYDQECKDLNINQKFYKQVCELEAYFVNKNQAHIEFFGGTLTGVQIVRFTSDDKDKLFTDILQIDDRHIQEKVYDLREKDGSPAIVQTRVISSDIFNISCIWLIHAFQMSTFLDENQKREGQIRIMQYMMYKFLTSIMFHNFKYPADPAIAAATYSQLSMKFALKQCGSWGATIRRLAENAVSLTGIHADVVLKMNDNKRVVNMLNDCQGRVKDILKNITSEHHRIKDKGDRISSSSSFIEIDGEVILKDKTKSLGNYIRYIKTAIPDQNSFIKQELVDVVVSIMHTMPEKLLMKSLIWTSKNYGQTRDQEIENAVDIVMEHAFEYLAANKAIISHKTDIAGMLSKLRGAYMSSRSTDAKLLEARELVEHIVYTATKSKNESVIAATRTGWMLYLCLRALTMRHYTS